MPDNVQNMPFKIPLWSHQLEALSLAKDRKFLALFHEMGCGKTATSTNIFRQKCFQKGRLLRLLILTPKIVKEGWLNEIGIHCADNAYDGTCILEGSALNRVEQLKDSSKFIFIANHETLTMPAVTKLLQSQHWDMVIIDESTRYKSGGQKKIRRFTGLVPIVDRAEFKLILTGQPIINGPMDLWAQMRLLSPTIFDGNFYSFRARFFYDENAGMPKNRHYPKWVLRPKMQGELTRIVNMHSHRVKKCDALDLPPLIRQTVTVDLAPEAKHAYERMKEDFVVALHNDVCARDTIITQMMALQQIASGIVPLTKSIARVECAKLAALRELLEDLTPDHKVIVWTSWRATYADIAEVCESLNIGYTSLTGDTKDKDRPGFIERFNTDPTCRVMIANQKAAGLGVNLQAASYSIYYSKTYSLEDDIQSEARNYRAGSEVHEKITRIDIVTKNTIEEQITEALWKKLEVSELILSMKESFPPPMNRAA